MIMLNLPLPTGFDARRKVLQEVLLLSCVHLVQPTVRYEFFSHMYFELEVYTKFLNLLTLLPIECRRSMASRSWGPG